MPILTPQEKATLAAKLADAALAGLAPEAAAAALSAQPMVPNPAPAPQLPRPFTVRQVVAAVAAARRPALKAYFRDLNSMVEAQDRKNLREFILTLIDMGDLQAADGQAIQAALSATDPDPLYLATVPSKSWAETTFPGREFAIPAAPDRPARSVIHQVTPEMIAEAKGP